MIKSLQPLRLRGFNYHVNSNAPRPA